MHCILEELSNPLQRYVKKILVKFCNVSYKWLILYYLVGSSRNRTAGLSNNSRPIESRLRSPPDKFEILVRWLFISPKVFKIISICRSKFPKVNVLLLKFWDKWKNTINFFSLLETLLPSFRWLADIMYSSTDKSCKRWSFCGMYADCLRNVLTSCFSSLTSTQPSTPLILLKK